MDTDYKPKPIIVGLAGISGTGKTATADAFAPQANFVSADRIRWDHLAFALPLKRLASARQDIEGRQAADRMHYEIHATLLDVFGNSPLYGAPPYDELIQLVYEIAEYPCPKDSKPREFLQQIGTRCREWDPQVWINWVDRKIKEGHRRFLTEQEQEYEAALAIENLEEREALLRSIPDRYGVIISDCRLTNELHYIKSHSDSILIKLTASSHVVAERQKKRDGFEMNGNDQKHFTENEIHSVADTYFDAVIDTDNLSLKDQAQRVRDVVLGNINIYT